MDAPIANADSETPPDKKPRRWRRMRRALIWLIVLGLVFGTFPSLWGPAIVAAWIRHTIGTPELGGTLEAVERVSLHSFSMRGLQLGAVPGTPTLDRIDAHYSPFRLLREKRLDSLDATGFRMDLSKTMPPDAAALFTNHLVAAEVHVRPTPGSDTGMTALLTGHALDWPVRGDATFAAALTNGFSLGGTAALTLPDTPWRADADFAVTTNGWSVDALIPAVEPDESDPLLGAIASRVPMPGVTDLAFHGAVWGNVHAEQTKNLPVPTWRAMVTLEDGRASLAASGTPIAVRGIEARVFASGIADRWEVAPIRPRIFSANIGDIELGAGDASLLVSEHSLLVTESSVAFCGGFLRLYALSFLPERLDAGFTLFVDNIDAGEFLTRLPNFHGTATGRLFGRIPLRIRNGKEVVLRDAFLYSPPGETGKLRIIDPSPIVENLAASGVPKETTDNLSKALADLDYTVLRIDLRRGTDAEESTIGFQIKGTATDAGKTVPVALAVNFHGALERLLNTGIRAVTGPGPANVPTNRLPKKGTRP